MIKLNRILTFGAVFAFTACSNGQGPGPSGQQVAFSVATKASSLSGAQRSGLSAASDTLGVGNDTLVYDTVQVLLRKIDLERTDASQTCGDDSGENSTGEHAPGISSSVGTMDGHDDDCEEVKAGPLILDLPLSAGAQHVFTVQVDTGTYEKVRFKVDTPTANSLDQTLLVQHPEFAHISVRVKGTFNKSAFSYTSDLTAEQEVRFPSPVSVSNGSTTLDLTLFVDVGTWFKDPVGNLIDPATAAQGQPNEQLVTENIRNSFKAFRDHDHDGEDDDHEGSHD